MIGMKIMILSIAIMTIIHTVSQMDNVTPLTVAEGITNYGLLAVVAGFFLTISGFSLFFMIKHFMKMINATMENNRTLHKELAVITEIFDSIRGQTKNIELVTSLINQNHEWIKVLYAANEQSNLSCTDAVGTWVFDNSAYTLIRVMDRVLNENNIEDKQFVEQKVTRIIDNFYSKTRAELDLFSFNGRKLSEFIQADWRDRMIHVVLDELYRQESFNRGRAVTNIKILFDDIKMEFYGNIRNKVY